MGHKCATLYQSEAVLPRTEAVQRSDQTGGKDAASRWDGSTPHPTPDGGDAAELCPSPPGDESVKDAPKAPTCRAHGSQRMFGLFPNMPKVIKTKSWKKNSSKNEKTNGKNMQELEKEDMQSVGLRTRGFKRESQSVQPWRKISSLCLVQAMHSRGIPRMAAQDRGGGGLASLSKYIISPQ